MNCSFREGDEEDGMCFYPETQVLGGFNGVPKINLRGQTPGALTVVFLVFAEERLSSYFALRRDPAQAGT